MTLTDAQFEHALHRGLGRALLFLRRIPDPERFRDVVLDSCLHFRGHSLQDEGPRTQYLLDAAQLTGISLGQLRDALLGSFTNSDAACDEQQRFSLLAELGARGDAQARHYLHDRYCQELEQDRGIFLFILPADIIAMDGDAGLAFVLRTQGQVLSAHPDRDSEPHELNEALDRLGQAGFDRLMQDLQDDPDVQHLLTRIEQDRAKWQRKRIRRPPAAAPPYAVARSWAQERPDGCGRLVSWGRHASDAQRRQAADDVLQEHDPVVVAALLCIFRSGRPFPPGLQSLLPFLDHPDGRVVTRAASYLFGQGDLPELREAALRMLQNSNSEVVVAAMPLLVKGYRADDDEALAAGLARVLQEGDPDWTQWYLKGLKDIAAEHPGPALLALLAAAFPEQPCSHCRDELVRVLDGHDALPRWLREEAALDANEDLRRYVRSGG